VWLSDDYDHQGVWIIDRVIDSDMVLNVPNSPTPNLYKLIWLQIVYSAHEDNAPIVYVLPEGGGYTPMVLQSTTQIDDMYSVAVFALTIRPIRHRKRFPSVPWIARYSSIALRWIRDVFRNPRRSSCWAWVVFCSGKGFLITRHHLQYSQTKGPANCAGPVFARCAIRTRPDLRLRSSIRNWMPKLIPRSGVP